MVLSQVREGGLSFSDISVNEQQKVMLMSFGDYIDSLNDYDNAACPINRYGNTYKNDVRCTVVEAENKTFRMIIGTEFNPIVYRGLNNDYVFMPDSQRYELFDGRERIRHSINWIKKHEFLSLISQTPYFTIPKSFEAADCDFEIDMEAIAKHYNYMSDYIDVTRDIMVAYFFAYTYYDKEKKQILPLENFSINTPVLYAASLRDLYKAVPDSVKNISWQPYLRPLAQKAMSVNTAKDRELIQQTFRRLELPKNPKIARYVYELFDGGNLLFQADYISRCANSVRDNKTLYGDLISQYCEETETDIKWLTTELISLGYDIVENPWRIPEQAKQIICKEYEDTVFPFLQTNCPEINLNYEKCIV